VRFTKDSRQKCANRNVIGPEGLDPNFEEADLSHKFAIGQTVHLVPSNAHNGVEGDYEIRHIMPVSDYQNEPRYRIRNVSERYERIVAESDLTERQGTGNV
jgi:hypothetical protein